MREWTREERYRVLHNAEEIRDLWKKNLGSVYRQTYHIQPVTGLSSDPNGFVLYRGVWHLFYQWCPWGAVHGLKYWYHVSSRDLVHWKNEGLGMKPDTFYDNRGVHSGSAIAAGGGLYVFYTGNHRDDDWVRTPYTCVAEWDYRKGMRKLPKPLFGPRTGYSEHQRDPKVFWNIEKQRYYIFLGAQSNEGKGRVLVYSSRELLKGWSFAGELKVPGYADFGGMWECPCIQRINGKDVLIFSPQYMKLPGRGESTNHNLYFIGKMDYDTLTFTPEGTYHHLDWGYDFYAAQMASGLDDPEAAVIIAWIGLPDNHYPTAEEDWEGSMCLPRELRIRNGRLVQNPVPALEELREQELGEGEKLPRAFEIELKIPDGDFQLRIFAREAGKGGFLFRYDDNRKVLTADRRGMRHRFNENVYTELEIPVSDGLHSIRGFIDHSSLEFFINEGEYTFTSHVYPTEEERGINVSDGAEMRIWPLTPSVKDDFVV